MTRHLSESKRRAQILNAARALFVERGYLAARVEDIAKRAGLSKGAVYFYFPSKRGIFDALCELEYTRNISYLREAEADSKPAVAKLEALAAQYLDYFAGLKHPPRFFLLMSEMAIRDDAVRDRVNGIHASYVKGLCSVLQQGIDEGLFREVDAEATAFLLKGLIDGLVGQVAVGVRLDVASLANTGVRILLHGLMKSPPTAGRD